MSDKNHVEVVNCALKAHPKAATELKLVRLKFICQMTWEKLAPTDNSAVRHCSKCDSPVTLCTTLEQAERLIRDGGCVAIPAELTVQRREQDPGSVLLGSPTSAEVRAHELESWGRRIFAQKP